MLFMTNIVHQLKFNHKYINSPINSPKLHPVQGKLSSQTTRLLYRKEDIVFSKFLREPPGESLCTRGSQDHATNKPSGSYPSLVPKCSTRFFQFFPR